MKQTLCPKCSAELPRKGQFCLECGLDLYAEGLRHPPVPWFRMLAIAAIVAGGLALLVIGPCPSQTAPEVATVTRRTEDLLGLLAKRDYKAAVARFYRPNARRFGDVEGKLHDIVRGQGAPGLNIVRSQGFRNVGDALAYVQKQGTEHPEYVARLLYSMAAQPEANPWLSPRRTEAFFAWYLEQAFGQLDVGGAELAEEQPRWEERVLAVTVHYPGPVQPLSGVADPRVIRWRLVGGWGGCGKQSVELDFGPEDHLAEVIDLLKRLPAE